MTQQEINLDEIIPIIDFHLRKRTNRRTFPPHDFDDVRQDIIVAIYEQSGDFDPDLSSWPTFVSRIAIRELESKRLQKRWQKHQSVTPLDEIEPEVEPATSLHSAYTLNEVEHHAFAGEIWDLIHTFPENLQAICERLSFLSKKTSAKHLEMEPPELTRGVNKIRQLFQGSKVFADLF